MILVRSIVKVQRSFGEVAYRSDGFFWMELDTIDVVAPYRRIELDAVMGFHKRMRWVIDMHTIGVDEVITRLTIYLHGQSTRYVR